MSAARSLREGATHGVRTWRDLAVAMDLRNDNSCDRVVPVLGPQNDIVTHRQALPHKDVAAAIGSAQPQRTSAEDETRISPDHRGHPCN